MVKNGWGKIKNSKTTKYTRTINNDASNIQDIIETMQNSLFDITNEIAKVHPRYAQSFSNFQAECLEAIKMILQTLSNFQSTLIKSSCINFDNRSVFYSGQIKNQVTTLTDNIIKGFDIWNQITLDSIDIAKENLKIYTEVMTSMDIHNRDLINSWNSFLISPYSK